MKLSFHESIAHIPASAWDELTGIQPFLRHAFLLAMESTGCVSAESGWQPLHASLEVSGKVIAAMPLYLKHHSWGEYVFDWAWADASQRAGLHYYPKLLSAIPFTPVSGARLLGISSEAKAQLLTGVLAMAKEAQLSGFHCLFPRAEDQAILQEGQLMERRSVQFHWHNRGYQNYADFLGSMSHDKRKKLKQERRRVTDAKVDIVRKTGRDITEADWAFFYDCYANTYRDHRSTPYLNLAFFMRLGELMGEYCLMVLASRDGEPVAAALNLIDGERLYGRYWGAKRFIPSLHFELCYHQGIEFAIERGLQVFEGGAQGEHKLARGFEPVEMTSWHWLADAGLRNAVAHFLARETAGVTHYINELEERAPFKAEANLP